MAKQARYQGGSIISFIIVTLLIAALLIGGVVWLRQRGEMARQEASEIAAEQGEGTTPPQEEETQNETQTGSGSGSTSTSSGSETGSQEGTSGTSSTGESGSTTGTPSSPTHLPETGPAEAAMTLIVLALVSYTATRYAMSRREVASLL